MEQNKTFWIIVIVTILTPMVESISLPLRDSYVARSLLSVSPPSSSPAPGPEVERSPSPSPEAPADSTSPANAPTMDSPSPSPEVDMMDSPSPSPGAPVDSTSPANPPTEMDIDSPSPSQEENSEAPSGKTLMSSATTLLKQTLLSPEIKTICGKTDNPALCESSVTPLLTSAVKPDASSVLVLAIQASINATKAAKPAVDKSGAADCLELYDDAATNLEDAINAVKESDIATVNSNLSAAMTDYVTCNDGFEESGEPSPLADVADKLTKMVSNCLAISSLIK
ncbi:hypothetical protein N665_0358s0034 [Sinapis alba]|nr:hypothetical protein N665_0358s0034 [Sinapis alba]